MIILFMDVYKVGLLVALVCNFGGFVSFLAGLFGFILAGTDIRRNSYMMDNFGQQKFNSEDNFVPHTDRQTDRQTDTRTHSSSLSIDSRSQLSNDPFNLSFNLKVKGSVGNWDIRL